MTTDALIKSNYHHGSLREALISAAIHRLQADGVAKLSLRGLAADVGVSPTAVYRHFEDKLALLAAIACDGFSGLTRNMQKYLGTEPTDAMTSLQRIGMGYIDYAIHHPAHYRLMFGQRMVERERFPDLYQTSAASFAMLGDAIIAEPKALIGFAGPRVIEQTIRQKLPEGFQRSEFLLKHGFLDRIVHRKNMKAELHQLFLCFGNRCKF